jgi:HD superfamily phosphohydrolase YqeK
MEQREADLESRYQHMLQVEEMAEDYPRIVNEN